MKRFSCTITMGYMRPAVWAAHQEQPSWTRSPRNPRKPRVAWRIFTTARPRRLSAPLNQVLRRPYGLGFAARFTPPYRSLRRRRPRAFTRRDAPHRPVDLRGAAARQPFRAVPRHRDHRGLRGLEKEGFFAVGVKQSASRDATKTDYTRHMIRLRRLDNAEQYRVGDAVCEIILKNANDGTAADELMAGLFRIRCLNSLVAQIATVDLIRVRHSGDALQKVVDGTYRVLGQAEAALAAPRERQPHRAR